jgi:hypothetical protein
VLLKQGEVAFDGKTREAIARYRQLLSADASPDELAAGLREWGSGEARVVSARLLDLDGDERRQFAAGEPFVVELRVATDADVPAPQLSLELRDDDGVALGGVTVATSELGWDARAGERELRFEVDRLPLAEGRFHLRCALLDGDGGRLLHSLGDAGQFFVVPTGAETGAVLLAGRWSMQEIGASEPIGLRQ